MCLGRHLGIMCLEVMGDRHLLISLIGRILHHRVLRSGRVQNQDMHFLEMLQERMEIRELKAATVVIPTLGKSVSNAIGTEHRD